MRFFKEILLLSSFAKVVTLLGYKLKDISIGIFPCTLTIVFWCVDNREFDSTASFLLPQLKYSVEIAASTWTGFCWIYWTSDDNFNWNFLISRILRKIESTSLGPCSWLWCKMTLGGLTEFSIPHRTLMKIAWSSPHVIHVRIALCNKAFKVVPWPTRKWLRFSKLFFLAKLKFGLKRIWVTKNVRWN